MIYRNGKLWKTERIQSSAKRKLWGEEKPWGKWQFVVLWLQFRKKHEVIWNSKIQTVRISEAFLACLVCLLLGKYALPPLIMCMKQERGSISRMVIFSVIYGSPFSIFSYWADWQAAGLAISPWPYMAGCCQEETYSTLVSLSLYCYFIRLTLYSMT